MSSCLRNDSYYLKTLKNYEHGPKCRYFKQSSPSLSSCSSSQAVIITENNGINVKLGLDFNKKVVSKTKSKKSSTTSKQTTSKLYKTRASTSIGAFLKYLYTMANLHYYRPEKNNKISHAFKRYDCASF